MQLRNFGPEKETIIARKFLLVIPKSSPFCGRYVAAIYVNFTCVFTRVPKQNKQQEARLGKYIFTGRCDAARLRLETRTFLRVSPNSYLLYLYAY